MNARGRQVWTAIVGGVAMAVISALPGCGISQNSVEQAQARMDSLSVRGAPDSVLSTAKLLLVEVKGARRAASPDGAQKAADLKKELARVEAWYQTALQSVKPELDAARKALDQQKAKLTGLHLKSADSLLVPVDSLARIGFVLQARAKLAKVEAYLPTLLEDEQKAAKRKNEVVGAWREVARPDGVGSTTVQTSTYTFGGDGALTMVEAKKGQSNPTLKENWEFNSWGTWEMKGDTVVLHVKREKVVRQEFDVLMRKEGKEYWEHKVHPTYDSTITNGCKDKWIEFAALKTDFKKVK